MVAVFYLDANRISSHKPIGGPIFAAYLAPISGSMLEPIEGRSVWRAYLDSNIQGMQKTYRGEANVGRFMPLLLWRP
jgi:hypothetical protein